MKKVFNVHVRLADQYEAESEEQAFDKMMELLEDRSGFEIMGHDIIEEKSGMGVREPTCPHQWRNNIGDDGSTAIEAYDYCVKCGQRREVRS